MFEGQEPPLLATATTRIDEGALSTVPLPDLPRDDKRDVSRIRLRLYASARLAGADSSLQLPLDEFVQGPFEERREVTGRQNMARQLTRLLDLGAERGARREFNTVALRGERLEPRARIAGKPLSPSRHGKA